MRATSVLMARLAALLIALTAAVTAADRPWQTGVWGEVHTAPSPSMHALADVYVYVIETDDLHLDLQDVVPVGRRSVDVMPGASVRFAIQKRVSTFWPAWRRSGS